VGSLKAISYNYDECRQALAKMVIIDELPFNFVEGRGFKLFTRTMQPRFDIPSHFTIMRDYLKLYVEENDRLRTALRGQRLCLTTDTWLSIQNINYMCLQLIGLIMTGICIKEFLIFVKFPIIWVRQLAKLLRIVCWSRGLINC